MSIAIIGAVCAVGSLGLGIYSAVAGGGGYSFGGTSVPANMITYDENGNVSQEVIWNASKQAYEQKSYPYGKAPDKPAAPTAPDQTQYYAKDQDGNYILDKNGQATVDQATWNNAQAQYQIELKKYNEETLPQWEKDNATWVKAKSEYEADKALTDEILKNKKTSLNMSWEERVSHYNEYADDFVKQQHAILDPQFEKEKQTVAESMASRGMTGSRAEVDTNAELEKAKSKSDEEVSTNANMYKYALANQELQGDLSIYNAIKAGQGADTALALQKQTAGVQGAVLGTQASLASTTAANNASYQSWLSNYLVNQSRSKSLTDTASGLAYLYGYGKKAGWWSPANSGGGSGVLSNSTSGYLPATADIG